MNIDHVVSIIKETAKNAGLSPGVYKMLDKNEKVIYIGKAKHLSNRLLSYTRINKMPNRLKAMVSNIYKVDFIIVRTEIESLLLEHNLIKEYKPFYNILLKDDKTFPYIVIDFKHDFPRIFKYRTLKPKGDNFYGPYPSIIALDETINIIQKVFLLRNCSDSYFNQRNRPCLQYFIKRCSGPCCNKISKEDYRNNVDLAKDLLLGKDETARKSLILQMNEYAKKQDFEKAANFRDRIKAITEIQSKQYIQIEDVSSMDFIGIAKGLEKSVVAISFFRAGKNVGSETFVIQNSFENDEYSYILESFIMQFYKKNNIPSKLIVSNNLDNINEISIFLENLKQYGDVKIIYPKQMVYKKIIDSCLLNANIKLKSEVYNKYHEEQIIELCKLINSKSINRIEVYDNSHIMGTNACGVMIVFENGSIQKNKVRKFNISNEIANSGDDISMMKFSLEKRFNSKRITEIPDLIIIDGGKTQVSIAVDVIKQFSLEDKVKVLGIAKQNNRKIGDEKIVLENGDEKILGSQSILLSFLIMLRNEAHKNAINFHRKKREKSLSKSMLDDIKSVGPYRKKKLLEHFGSVENIKKASIDDLKMVKGISSKEAEVVFQFFVQTKGEKKQKLINNKTDKKKMIMR